jgi:hypothetical protein
MGLSRSILFSCALIVGLSWINQSSQAQEQLSAEESARKSQIYDNPRIFAEMSGAKRTALERKFGPRPERGVAFTGEEFTDQALRMFAAPTGPTGPTANTLVNNPSIDTTGQDTQSETAVIFGAGPNVVAAFNDSGAHIGGASRFTGWSLSTDGGATFTDKGDLPASPDGDSGDPVFARSAKTGTIFLSTLSFNTGHKLLIFRSTNNGTSFNVPVNGAPGFTPVTGEQDKQWIATDNQSGPGFGNVYMFWRNFAAGGGMVFSRSTDDGLTWGPNGGIKLANGGQGAYVAVGQDHAVYAFWYDSSVSPREIKVRKSTDQGASFSAAVTVVKLKATGINGDLGLNPGFRSNSFPQVVASPTNANHLYVVFNDHSGAGGTLDRGDIYLVSSLDGGATWSVPVKVNDDATLHDQWQPAIAITPDGIEICVAWYDRRLDPTNTLIDRFATTGIVNPSGAISFEASARVTDQSFPAVVGVDPIVNGTYMGDYDQITGNNIEFGVTWGDNRDDSTGHTGKNANVRYAKVLRAQSDEPSIQFPIENVPEFARNAIDLAVDEAPAGVLNKPIDWQQAFEIQETIAMYQLKGKDAKGQPVETEVKGTRVIELEVLVPSTQVPQAVRTRAAAEIDNFDENSPMVAVIVRGQIVAYSTAIDAKPDDEAAVAEEPSEVNLNFAPNGELLGPERPEN